MTPSELIERLKTWRTCAAELHCEQDLRGDLKEACDLIDSLTAELAEAEKRAARYRKALIGLKRCNSCWCEVAIDNPMLGGRHLPQCDKAREALASDRDEGEE